MKLWQLAATVGVGVMYSGSGALQVNATIYNFFVDFSTKEVADYTDYTQTFNSNTSGLTLETTFTFQGSYRYDSCPTTFTQNVIYAVYNGSSPFQLYGQANLPDFTCTTTSTSYFAQVDLSLPSTILDNIVNDDALSTTFYPHLILSEGLAMAGRTLTLSGFRFYFDLQYDFGTTYLFNYFLSDQQYLDRLATPTWTFTGTQSNYLQYVYTTAGNDEYFIYNSSISSIGTTRKKYAVDYNDEYFRGQSVGAGFTVDHNGSGSTTMDGVGQSVIAHRVRYHYLNLSNKEQNIENVPEFEFEYEDCGSFLALNVPCFINNGLAYVVNDAPVISDAFTLLNAGMKLGGQAFSIIGQFSDNNLFGVLVLGGLGITAVRWFLKQD